MRLFPNRYPKGTIPLQREAGRYFDTDLYENLRTYAKNIVKDMTFLGFVSSSTLEVGTGKSVFVQQMGEAWENLLLEEHGIERPLELRGIVFKPEDLIDEALKLPKYSCIILDEWEDAHYWSKLGMTLRQFFRKCRQLNLFMICIIPNFFELPLGYAVSRSAFFIDVYFGDNFERGFFKFYNFPTKKMMFLKGKKTQDYNVVYPNFKGEFRDGYVVPKQDYLDKKRKDLEEKEPLIKPTDVRRVTFYELYEGIKGLGVTDELISKAFRVSLDQMNKWKREGADWINRASVKFIGYR